MLPALWVCPRPAPTAAVASAPTAASASSPAKRRVFTVSSLSEVESCTCRRSRRYLLLPPARSVRKGELGQRLGPDLDAVTGRRRGLIAPVDDVNRIDEVLVQVVDELTDAVVE